MCLALELRRTHVGNPDLDWPEPRVAQAVAVLTNPLPDLRLLFGDGHTQICMEREHLLVAGSHAVPLVNIRCSREPRWAAYRRRE